MTTDSLRSWERLCSEAKRLIVSFRTAICTHITHLPDPVLWEHTLWSVHSEPQFGEGDGHLGWDGNEDQWFTDAQLNWMYKVVFIMMILISYVMSYLIQQFRVHGQHIMHECK